MKDFTVAPSKREDASSPYLSSRFLKLPWAGYVAILWGLLLVVTTLLYYSSHASYLTKNNISLALFLSTFFVTLSSPYWGMGYSFVCLGIAPAAVEQMNALLNLSLIRFPSPGLDIVFGFSLASLLRYRSITRVWDRLPKGLFLLIVSFLTISSLVACLRNVWMSGSVFSVRGFIYNLILSRDLSWHDDYYPLKDLLAYCMAGLFLICIAVVTSENRKKAHRLIFGAMFVGGSLNFILSFWQHVRGVGWLRDGIAAGLNGFWPDLHAFAGYMIVCAYIGLWACSTTQFPRRQRLFGFTLFVMSMLCVYWSRSRFTFIFGIGCIALIFSFLIFKSTGSRRRYYLTFLVASLMSLGMIVYFGFRGFDYDLISKLYHDFKFDKFNIALSERPEIFITAWKMYSQFPWFGLGQGAFNDLASIQGFSESRYLLSRGGENAHSYVLQTFVELGPMGFFLLTLLILKPLRNLHAVDRSLIIWILFGILAGNTFAHGLLIRETLMLAAGFFGVAYACSDMHHNPTYVKSSIVCKRLIAGVSVLVWALVAFREVRSSFHTYPFEFGRNCFIVSAAPSNDGWTTGLFKQNIPPGVYSISIELDHGHPDVERRPLELQVDLQNAQGEILLTQVIRTSQHNLISFNWPKIDIESLPVNTFSIRSSRCFVPLNLGLSYDPRPLGFRIKNIHLESFKPS